jgi:hypothetical protein
MRIASVLCFVVFLGGMLAIPVQARPQVAFGVSVRIGPPVLPVYEQPICPGPGFIWVPGYWAWGDDGYFWVPGTWVEPPEVGFLWTPGYWGFDDGFYLWHAGYWGPHVGFYGGIDYGFGYPGVGFYGGYWRGRDFFYNRAVTNVNVEFVHNTYESRVVNNNRFVARVSFNGRGGVNARPTDAERFAERDHHISMTSAQVHQREFAGSNREMLASVNHGRPDVAATPRAGQFEGRGGFTANRPERANSNRPPDNVRESNRSFSNGRNADRPPTAQPRENNRVNPAMNARQQRDVQKAQENQDRQRQKMEQEQAKQQQKQVQERQRMEQQQSRQQQRLVQQRAGQERQQQLQQRQSQQREQMQVRHDQQTQRLQQRQQREVQRQAPRQSEKPANPGKPHGH